MAIVSMRTLFAGLLLVVVLVARGGRLPLRWNLWKRMIFLGATNIVLPFALIAWGQQYIPSGLASILNAMVPLFTIVFAALALADEHITAAKLGGLGIGFLGVIVLTLPSLEAASADQDAALAAMGMLAVAGASGFYGIASVYTRRRVTGMPIIEQPDGTRRAPLPVEISLGSTVAAFLDDHGRSAHLRAARERPAGHPRERHRVGRPSSGWASWAPVWPTSSSSGSSSAGAPLAPRS